ncbi:MAG TPA: glycosyltransferase family 39 protein, partial [Lacunisphaera sp.]|nr:glycosyltransferase family 39 protein [Lacunisphaera sp.]
MARFAQATQRTGAAWAAFFLLTVALWLRWPAFGFSLWNVDEAIHAAAARVILEGGVLYRDAIDQRTPLSYYVVAGVFALFGENNLWAVRCFVALLIAATGWLLFLAARRIAPVAAGVAAGTLYVLLASATLFQGDANAANSEWFVAFFSSACVLVFLSGGSIPSHGRLFAAGLLSGCSFLSKQPALLDSAGPLAALLYANWRTGPPSRALVLQLGWFTAGLLTPVLLSIAWFAAHGALADALFYAWHYNLSYYGPEISTADRVGSLAAPFRLIGSSQPWLLALWLGGAVVILHRLLQRVPTATESTTNASRLLVAVWSLAGLAGAASGGRAFDHYSIQFLAPFFLGAGLVLGSLAAGACT